MSEYESVPADVEDESEIPKDHPRYQDLVTRHRIERGVESGITHLQGMHAEGRGSAFDYLLGERTTPSADEATRVAAATLLAAEQPVLSVNGNVAALAPEEIVELANIVDADIEINLFNRTDQRLEAIASHLRSHGATDIQGMTADARIPGLDHERAKVDSDGIYTADVVLVPLEDGDRAEALSEMGKTEIVIDLNPLSRSQRIASVPIVDNLVRAIPNMIEHVKELDGRSEADLRAIIDSFDPTAALDAAEEHIRSGL